MAVYLIQPHKILQMTTNNQDIYRYSNKWPVILTSKEIDCNRGQVCKVGKILSSMKSIKTGVPQGSNLGLLLFLIYINILPNCLSNTTPALFADDTNVAAIGTFAQDNEEKSSRELNNLHS